MMDTLIIECPALADNGKFPLMHTGRGQDISPEFHIKNLSSHAKTLAITLEDTTHPLFHDFTHWLIWNIPACEKIEAAIPHGKTVPILANAQQGIGYGMYRYAGPKPPKGKQHLYRFTIYALDSMIDLPFSPTKKRFLKKAQTHILQQGSIVGKFE